MDEEVKKEAMNGTKNDLSGYFWFLLSLLESWGRGQGGNLKVLSEDITDGMGGLMGLDWMIANWGRK
jgi:hypothetical protein